MKEKNIKECVKSYLMAGGTLTHNQALVMYGTNRLAVYIRRLREDGMVINTTIVKEKDSTYGVYSL